MLPKHYKQISRMAQQLLTCVRQVFPHKKTHPMLGRPSFFKLGVVLHITLVLCHNLASGVRRLAQLVSQAVDPQRFKNLGARLGFESKDLTPPDGIDCNQRGISVGVGS